MLKLTFKVNCPFKVSVCESSQGTLRSVLCCCAHQMLRAGGQMGEKAEVSCAVSLRSGRGLYLSTLTLAVSLLRGTFAIITAAQWPIRAQLCGGHMHQTGEWLTITISCEQKLLLCLQATNWSNSPSTTLHCQEMCQFAVFKKKNSPHNTSLHQ